MIEQLTSQLHNEKALNEKFQKKLEKQNREMMEYEKEIFEKNEKINYLNFMIRKKGNTQVNDESLVENRSEGETNRIIAELRAQVRKYEVELMNTKKRSKNMEN